MTSMTIATIIVREAAVEMVRYTERVAGETDPVRGETRRLLAAGWEQDGGVDVLGATEDGPAGTYVVGYTRGEDVATLTVLVRQIGAAELRAVLA